MFDTIDITNDINNLAEDSVLVSFDIAAVLIMHLVQIEALSEILENRKIDFQPVEYILEALTLQDHIFHVLIVILLYIDLT